MHIPDVNKGHGILLQRLWFDVYCRRSAPYKWLCMYV